MNRILPSLLVILSLSPIANAKEDALPLPQVFRKDLLTATLASPKPISTIEIMEVTLGPKIKAPLHLHPCPVLGIVSAGEIAFQIEGAPVQHLKVGDAFYEPANARIARFDNEGNITSTFSAFYLLDDKEQQLIRILPQ
ncbi:MAG: cupin domain-containing protein [Sideroxydans sp.]|nr:cupin domain-containing protein [Sideroxydans sp.]